MKVIDSDNVKGIIVAEGSRALCLAVLLPYSKAQIGNVLFDKEEEYSHYRNRLANIFKCDDLRFSAYTPFEYNNKFTAYARSLAEELAVDEFEEVVLRVKEEIAKEK